MIKAIRVDDNLLHGQIAFSWVINLQIHMILIADDKVCNDQFSKMTLGLSKPPLVNLTIVSVDEAIEIIKLNDKMNIMIIVKTLENAEKIINSVDTIKSCNIGLLRCNQDCVFNYGSMSMNKFDIAICKRMINLGIEVEYRLRYTDQKVYINNLL